MTTLLVDGDIVIYQTACTCETGTIDWGDGQITPKIADLKEAKGRLNDRIAGLKKDTGSDRVVLAIKGKGNFRLGIYPEYKANRKNVVRPMLLDPLVKYALEAFESYQRPMLEGDDTLGILATSQKIIPGEKLIWSQDKDILTIPGKHVTEDFHITDISESEANYRHMIQTLTGDATDGYSGCPGIGPVKAKRILSENPGPMWRLVVAAYKTAGFDEAFAMTMARIARICRVSDYDFKRKEVILWNPPLV